MSGASRGRGDGRSTIPGFLHSDRLRFPRRTFDGPASAASGSASPSRRSSNPPSVGGRQLSPSRSRQVSGSIGQGLAGIPTGDPARDEQPKYSDNLKNVDLPASFFNIDNAYALPTEFKKRPGFNNSGKPVQLQVNSYEVTQFPKISIYQYDVIIGNGAEHKAVNRKVWHSKLRKEKTGPQIIFDGNKLAWSFTDYKELRMMVDLDEEQGQKSVGGKNTFRLHVRKTKILDPAILQAFLDGRVQMGIPVAEAINFMDHLLREGPSTNPNLVTFKRSFFKSKGQATDLSGGIEVVRGIYQSMRLAEGKKLVINLDVSNTCFWKQGSLLSVCVARFGIRDPHEISQKFQPLRKGTQVESSKFHKRFERELRRISVVAEYEGNPNAGKVWTIEKVLTVTSAEHKIQWKDPVTRKETGEMVTIHQYFRRRYNVALKFPNQPLVQMTKKNVLFPFEFLRIAPHARYGKKLDDIQTANMIKFAVSTPPVRQNSINEGKAWLDWSKDQYLTRYGLQISNNPITTNGRLLPPPGIKFGNKVEQPGTKGRWDLKGKTFHTANPQELVAWGVGMFPGRTKPDKQAIDKFVMDFSRAYRTHGGKVGSKPPNVIMLPEDPGKAVEMLQESTGNMFQRRPQLLVFLVPDKGSPRYLRIKRSADCRYGVVSQVMQLSHVLKGSPQYYSNVLMKVNAKLGGCTSEAVPNAASGTSKQTKVPTMYIGADVSHAAPGSTQASMAALTVSFDRHFGRYVAACETNGYRDEMITEDNMKSMLRPLIIEWQARIANGRLPEQIFYMRDGVSEGQFAHVMRQEVPRIRAVLEEIAQKPYAGKLTVIVASKRHHIRAFPGQNNAAGDPKGNPLPGVLIEKDVTMPNEWDFFLYSHIALQGTSRPVHYTVLHDDANHKPEVLQNMIYEHCYQYMRSTTSVSLHPAVYYAHIASNRARSHLHDLDALSMDGSVSGVPMSGIPKPLLKMAEHNKIQFSMWYI